MGVYNNSYGMVIARTIDIAVRRSALGAQCHADSLLKAANPTQSNGAAK